MKAIALAVAAASAGYPNDQLFSWRDGAVYQVTARPGRVTDIALQPGETLSGGNPVAAGDTVRWIIGDAESGAGGGRQAHILIKPVEAGLATNLVIATDRRTYHVELRSTAAAYMASVAWRYPEGEFSALKGRAGPLLPGAAIPTPPAPPAADLAALNFDYRLEGSAPFRPVRVYDDGRRTVIEFPERVASGEMPPLFVMSAKGDAAELATYRVAGRRMIVDRIFDVAELRLGAEKAQSRVRIVRDAKAAGR